MSVPAPIDTDEPIWRDGGPNWCFLCDNPSDSDVEYLNFSNYSGVFHVEFLCEEHLWDVLAEQEEDVLDMPMSFIRY